MNGVGRSVPSVQDRTASRSGVGFIGLGAAACAACCAGPIVGAIAAIGIGTVAGVALFGGAGLVIAVVGGAWLAHRRRGRSCAPPDSPVPVAAPVVKRSL